MVCMCNNITTGKSQIEMSFCIHQKTLACVCVHAVCVAWGVLEHDGCSVCAYVCWVCMCAHGARRRDGGTLSTCCINYFWQQNFLFHKVGCYLPYFSCSLLFIITYFGKNDEVVFSCAIMETLFLQVYKDLLLGKCILTVNKKVNLHSENNNVTIVNLCNNKILGLSNFLNWSTDSAFLTLQDCLSHSTGEKEKGKSPTVSHPQDNWFSDLRGQPNPWG